MKTAYNYTGIMGVKTRRKTVFIDEKRFCLDIPTAWSGLGVTLVEKSHCFRSSNVMAVVFLVGWGSK